MTTDSVAQTMTTPVDMLRAQLGSDLERGRLDLPSLPPAAAQALELNPDRSADAALLSAMIHRDGRLSAHLLRLASSTAFGGRSDIVSLRHAVDWLGLHQLTGMIVDLSMRNGLFHAPGHADTIKRLWRHSLSAGFYAKTVARMRRLNSDMAFLCGLFRNIGKPVVVRAAARVAKQQGIKVPRKEMTATAEAFNRPAGYLLATRWCLPDPVIASIGFDPDSNGRSLYLDEARTAYMGDRLANQMLSRRRNNGSQPWEPVVSQALELGPDAVNDLLKLGPDIAEMVDSVAP